MIWLTYGRNLTHKVSHPVKHLFPDPKSRQAICGHIEYFPLPIPPDCKMQIHKCKRCERLEVKTL